MHRLLALFFLFQSKRQQFKLTLRSLDILVGETSALAKIFSLLNQKKTAISFYFGGHIFNGKKVGFPFNNREVTQNHLLVRMKITDVS